MLCPRRNRVYRSHSALSGDILHRPDRSIGYRFPCITVPIKSAASLRTQLVSWLHAAAPSLPAEFGNTESIHPKALGPLGDLNTSSQDVSSGPILAPREALQRLKQGCELQARTQCDNPTRKMNEKRKATEKGPKEEGSMVAHACHLSTKEAEWRHG